MRVGGLSKWVMSRLISTLKREPNWGYDTYKSFTELLIKSPDPPSEASGLQG